MQLMVVLVYQDERFFDYLLLVVIFVEFLVYFIWLALDLQIFLLLLPLEL
jgi:hypothetical protein